MMTKEQLPNERDFVPVAGNLDARWAWKHFGGLTLEEAFVRFCEKPFYYQEDFMFMGPAALAFYYPVLERYLHGIPGSVIIDDSEAWIISQGLLIQFERKEILQIDHLKYRVIDLAKFVLNNIQWFGTDDDERKRVTEAWQELANRLRGDFITAFGFCLAEWRFLCGDKRPSRTNG